MAYLLVRITGVALAVLVLGHFAVTHLLTDVANTNAAFIGHRWASAVWVAWDWLMLGAAFSHGGAGLWVIIDDHTVCASARRRRHAVLVCCCGILWLLGTALIVVAIAP
jgi:succinate dehydrogenase hydrophobic anchor subunit